jgi:hypothetical protein
LRAKSISRASAEAHDEVVGVAHDHNATACMASTPAMYPKIKNVVQEDVGEERANARTLRGIPVSFLLLAALKDSSPQPQLNEPQNTRIGNPVRHHPQQPLVVNRVKEAADVGIEHPVHALAHDRGVQRIKGQLRISPRPEAIGEPAKVSLINGVHHLGDRALDDLVLKRWDPRGRSPPSAFGI